MIKQATIDVMLVDDHTVIRQGFKTFLKVFPELKLVAEAENGCQAVTLCDEIQPDVILMDMVMPEMNGIDATRHILQNHPQIKIIAMTSFTENSELVRDALSAGAIGYLFKDIGIDDLANAIHAAMDGTPVLAPQAARMLAQLARTSDTPDWSLSKRELQVLKRLVSGMNNPEIAEALYISRSTVKFHVSSILSKMDVTTRTEAVALAVQHHLIDDMP